jgi:hypothetical protein
MSDKTLAQMASAEEHMEVPVEIAVANSAASGVLGNIRKHHLLLFQLVRQRAAVWLRGHRWSSQKKRRRFW